MPQTPAVVRANFPARNGPGPQASSVLMTGFASSIPSVIRHSVARPSKVESPRTNQARIGVANARKEHGMKRNGGTVRAVSIRASREVSDTAGLDFRQDR